MEQAQRIALATGGLILLGAGVGGLLLRRKNELPPPQNLPVPYGWQPGFPLSLPPGSYYASNTPNFDEADFGGGWILRDVRGIKQPPTLDPDKDAHVGMVASLVFTYGDKGVPKVFNTRIIDISGDDFQGQWMTKPPEGSGVQLPAFRGAHIFTLRKS